MLQQKDEQILLYTKGKSINRKRQFFNVRRFSRLSPTEALASLVDIEGVFDPVFFFLL